MTSTITPEVVGYDATERLADTDLTPTELARVTALELTIKTADSTILEQRIAEGEALFKIQTERLYRSRGSGERFTWEQYLGRFTPQLTKNGKGFGKEAAQLRCLLYLFHSGQIVGPTQSGQQFPLPTSTTQLIPLLAKAPSRGPSAGGGFDLDGDWTAVLEIWKAAVSRDPSPDKMLVASARSAYEHNQLRAGANPGRMASPAQAAAREQSLIAARSTQAAAATAPAPTPAASPLPLPQPVEQERTVPAWGLERNPDDLDASAECRRISSAFNTASHALRDLRGILFNQISRHGSVYLETLRQVDAGAWSLHDIDNRVAVLQGDIEAVAQLVAWEGEPGELHRSTVDAESFPTR